VRRERKRKIGGEVRWGENIILYKDNAELQHAHTNTSSHKADSGDNEAATRKMTSTTARPVVPRITFGATNA
jgi:hypothetical protein